MKIHCPNCERLIPAEHMNVAADVGVCPDCDETFCISARLSGEDDWRGQGDIDLNAPPSGVSFDNHGIGWHISASTRSWVALFLVPFVGVWSGFSLGGLYGTQFAEGEFDLFKTLFGIPFVLGTLLFGSFAIMTVLGRVVVAADEMDPDQATIFTGVGMIGSTRSFRWSEVVSIGTHTSTGKHRTRSIRLIREQGDIKFGGMLSDDKRRFVMRALEKLVLSRRRQ